MGTDIKCQMLLRNALGKTILLGCKACGLVPCNPNLNLRDEKIKGMLYS